MIGKMVAQYKIMEEIGHGGLGVVYKAEDTRLKRTVALKFLKSTALGSKEQKTRFVREAQATAALSHPSICTVYEIGEREGKAFIAMAYVEGSGLDVRIRQGPLPIDEVLSVAIQVGEGLQEAHEQGIIHRDIKSGNIRVTPKGRAKILDFGLARMAGQTAVTQEGVSMGTISYMSPEQAKGEKLDHRTDIWSFGVVLYEMIAGSLPFRGDNASAVLYSVLNDGPEPIAGLRADIPAEIDRIVTKALAKDPRERYQQMDDMLLDLRTLKQQYETGTVAMTSIAEGVRSPQEGRFLGTLTSRRILLAVAIYVIAGLAVAALAGYAVDRLPISPRLPQFTLVVLASLLPAVILLAHYRGGRGVSRWTKPARIGIPVNIIGSVLILVVLLRGEPLATTTRITTTNEAGETIEVEIPRQEFRKRIAIFHFKNETGDSTLNWMQYAVPRMLHFDLLQDIYIDVRVGFLDELRAAGFADGTRVPIALMRRIAERRNRGYFTWGRFSERGDRLVLTNMLYQTGRAEVLAERTFSGTDLLALVDEMSTGLKHDLDIPEYHIEATPDRALSETLTDSRAALEEYGLALADLVSRDHASAAGHLEVAVHHDPTFALAQWELYLASHGLARPADMTSSLLAAMQHIYKLPTFYQYIVRTTYHEHSEDVESALETAKDWVKLYPQSIDAHEVMAAYYEVLGDLDSAIAEWSIIFELDPEQHNLLQQLGDLYARKGEYERGLEYLEQYKSLYPEDFRSYSAIGDLYSARGEYEEARSFYETARRHAPDEIDLSIEVADLEMKIGNFEQARRDLEDALDLALVPQNRSQVYAALKEWHKMMGQISTAEEYLDLYIADEESRSPMASAVQNTFFWVELCAFTENTVGAQRVVEELEAQVGEIPMLRFFPKYARIWYYSFAKDKAHLHEAEALLAEIETIVDKNPSASLEAMVLFAGAGVHVLRDEYKQAAELAERAIALFTMFPQDQRIFLSAYILGDMYRRAGELSKAEEKILERLDLEPSQPFFHAILGRTYRDMERTDEALLHLRQALDVWKDADSDFKPSREPREALAELESAPHQSQ